MVYFHAVRLRPISPKVLKTQEVVAGFDGWDNVMLYGEYC
jgi:hypothetical protein